MKTGNIKTVSITPKPFLSIITVCFNSAATIERTINSVFQQKFKNYEYIIIDGGSTDGTIAIIEHAKEKFRGKLSVYSEPDDGIYDAMNKGIRKAQGKLIGILNSDDWYENDAFNTIGNHYNVHGDGIYYGILRYHRNGKEYLLKRDHHSELHKGMIQHPTCFVSKNVYDKIGTYNLAYRIVSDYEFMLRASSQNIPFYPIDRILANFSEGGCSNVHENERIREMYAIQHMYKIISKRLVRLFLFKRRLAALIDKLGLRAI